MSARETCLRCGYDIRGREGDATCPECGLPVRVSRDAGRSDVAANAALSSVTLLGAVVLGVLAFVPFVRGAAVGWFVWLLTTPPCFDVAHILLLAAVLWIASTPLESARSTWWRAAARLLALSTPAILLAVSAAIVARPLDTSTLTPSDVDRVAVASASIPLLRIALMTSIALSLRGRWSALGLPRRGLVPLAGAVVYAAANVPLILRPWLEPYPQWHSQSGDLEQWAALGVMGGLAIVGAGCVSALVGVRRLRVAANAVDAPATVAAPRSLLVAAVLLWTFVAVESSRSLFPANHTFTSVVFGLLALTAIALMHASWRLGVARPGLLSLLLAASLIVPAFGFLISTIYLCGYWDLQGMWDRGTGWVGETDQPHWTLVAVAGTVARLAAIALPLWCLIVATRLRAAGAYALSVASIAIALVLCAMMVAAVGAWGLGFSFTFSGPRESLGGQQAAYTFVAISCALLYLRARQPSPLEPIAPPLGWEFLLGSAAILQVFLSRYLLAPTPEGGAFVSWHIVSLLFAVAFVWASCAPQRSATVRWTLRALAIPVAVAPLVALASLGFDLQVGPVAVPDSPGVGLSFSFATPRFYATARFVRESPATFFAMTSECAVVAGSLIALAPRWMRAPAWLVGGFATLLALALGTVLSTPGLGWRAVPWATRFNRSGSDPMVKLMYGILRPITFDGLLFVVWAMAEAPRVAARWARRDAGRS